MRIGIMGHGEIGKAVEQVYFKQSSVVPLIRDLNRNDGLHNLDVLNICIPYTEEFVRHTVAQITESAPQLTIIHSTVKPGTTALIKDVTEAAVVHSPVRGVHPNLYEGLMTFKKFIGAESMEDAEKASQHLDMLRIKTQGCFSARTTEFGKLFSTTYYGLLIAWHGEMKEMCDKHGVNFEEAVTDFNNSYNTGYQKLNQLNVVRPTLYPPGSKIGGHCILQNLEILKNFHSSEAFSLIDKYKGE
jgi:UDP-N-acetyl-D-mannosaminuronate dehydrogenase